MDRNVDNSLIIREINMRLFTDFSAYDFQSIAARIHRNQSSVA